MTLIVVAFGRYVRSAELCDKVKLLSCIAYPVELGIRLRELVYPLNKLFDEEFGIGPDERSYIEEFVVSCNACSAEQRLCV